MMGNRFTSTSLIPFSKGLKHNRSLYNLDLTDNRYGTMYPICSFCKLITRITQLDVERCCGFVGGHR